MYFLIENDDLLEKYSTLWDKVSAAIKKEFDSEPVYNKTRRNFSLVTRCKIRSLLVAKIHLLLITLLISIATYYVKSLLTRANFS